MSSPDATHFCFRYSLGIGGVGGGRGPRLTRIYQDNLLNEQRGLKGECHENCCLTGGHRDIDYSRPYPLF